MSRVLASTLSQAFTHATVVATAAPITMASWIRPTIAQTQNILSIGDTGGTDDRFDILIRDTGIIRAGCRSGGAFNSVSSTAALPINTWGHAAGVFASSTSRTVYLNGGNSATNTTATTPTSIDTISVGVNAVAIPNGYFNGEIEWPAIWDVALTAAEILALSRGEFPGNIRPQNLVFLGDTRANTPDLVNIAPKFNRNLRLANINGTPPRQASPAMLRVPRAVKSVLRYVKAAAGGTAYTQALAGALTAAGVLIRDTVKGTPLGGSITASATLASQAILSAALNGSITAAGAISRVITRSLSGSLTAAGSVLKSTSRALAGSLTAAGTFVRSISRALAGGVTIAATLAKSFTTTKATSGSTTPSGTVSDTPYIAPAASGVAPVINFMRRFIGRR